MIWISEEEKKIYESIERNFFMGMLFGNPVVSKERFERNKDNRKMAYIRQGKTEFAAWVDNETMEAYRMDRYEKTWMKIKTFSFVRWMSLMDV